MRSRTASNSSRSKVFSHGLGNAPREHRRHCVADLPLGRSHARCERELVWKRLKACCLAERNASIQRVVPLHVAVVFGADGGRGFVRLQSSAALFGIEPGSAPNVMRRRVLLRHCRCENVVACCRRAVTSNHIRDAVHSYREDQKQEHSVEYPQQWALGHLFCLLGLGVR